MSRVQANTTWMLEIQHLMEHSQLQQSSNDKEFQYSTTDTDGKTSYILGDFHK